MKEKQPYEKPKMTFVENQPERRKSLKKEKIVPVFKKTDKKIELILTTFFFYATLIKEGKS